MKFEISNEQNEPVFEPINIKLKLESFEEVASFMTLNRGLSISIVNSLTKNASDRGYDILASAANPETIRTFGDDIFSQLKEELRKRGIANL